MNEEKFLELAQKAGFQVSLMLPANMYKVEPIGNGCQVELRNFARLVREQCIRN